MVAPKGSGTMLRILFKEGKGTNSSFAVYQDATGRALERTLALGIGIGSGYLFETTFQREAVSDLTGVCPLPHYRTAWRARLDGPVPRRNQTRGTRPLRKREDRS